MKFSDAATMDSPGYFRIGDVVLSIPPEAIRVSRAAAMEELTPLNSRFPFLRRTGRARIDVAVSWKAVADFSSSPPDYSDWLALRRVYAMVCAAPFVEVENAHLRQLMQDEAGVSNVQPLSFALKSLRVQTHPDSPDILEALLEMCWFEPSAYTPEFRYDAPTASQSDSFKAYLDRWIRENMDNSRSRSEYPSLASWDSLAPGVLNFRWREYILVNSGTAVPPSSLSAAVSSPSGSAAAGPSLGYVKGSIPQNASKQDLMNAIVREARRYGVDPALALAVVEGESGFNPKADAGPKGGQGLFQILRSTGRGLGLSEEDLHDPAANIDGGLRLLKSLLNYYGGDERSALAAYFVGIGNWNRYGAGQPGTAEIPTLKSQIRGRTNETMQVQEVLDTVDRRMRAKEKFARLLSLQPDGVFQQPDSGDRRAQDQEDRDKLVSKAMQEGFLPDYYSDSGVFLYRERMLHLCGEDYVCGYQHPSPNPSSMAPVSFAVIVSNRLAPMPVSQSALPTFQFCGSRSALVLIGMHSIGRGDDEPYHPGARALSSALRQLEQQYIELKPAWKKIGSLHRMQALLVEAQPLALFGIYGLMPRGLSSSTLPESSNMIEVVLEGVQWENLYEQVEPYAVKQDPDEEQEILEGLLSGDSRYLPSEDFLKSAFQKTEAAKKNPSLFERLFPAQPGQDRPSGRKIEGVELPEPSGARYFGTRRIQIQSDGGGSGSVSSEREQLAAALREALRNNPEFARAVSQARNRRETISFSRMEKSYRNAYFLMGLPLDERLHPAMYFADGRKALLRKLADLAPVLSSRISQSLSQLNADVVIGSGQQPRDESRQSGSAPAGINLKTSFADSTALLSSLVRNGLNPGWRSMKAAFPVCKVFLVNEEGRIPLLQFDDFYSVNSVLGFEIIRYKDKPDMLLLRLSNSANLLRHRLFDSSVLGRFEKKNAFAVQLPVTADGEPMTGPAGVATAVTMDVNWRGVDRLVVDDFRTQTRAPLQMFPLQTGTKIEVRAGYDDDPDRLPVVFSGLVTAIEDGEIMEITAHGFAIELAVPAPDELRSDGYTIAWLGDIPQRLISALTNLARFEFREALGMVKSVADKGPAYGGLRMLGAGGDAQSVMAALLKVSAARHFGGWLAMVPPTDVQALKGYSYIRLLEAPQSSDASAIRRLIGTIYDRRSENICIASRILHDGQKAVFDPRKSGWFSLFSVERPLYIFPPAYYVPADPSITPWRILQDVRRRHPSHELLVKHYGYPDRTEATLVFAHPADFYYARLPYPNENQELYDAARNGKADEHFFSWWKSRGRQSFVSIYQMAPRFGAHLSENNSEAEEDAKRIDQGGMAEFLSLIEDAANFLSKREFLLDQPVLRLATTGLGMLLKPATFWTSDLAVSPEVWRTLRMNLVRLRDEGVEYVRRSLRAASGQSDESHLSLRIRPVRKYHVVTNAEILYNNLSLNENIYNAVKIGYENSSGELIAANAGLKVYGYGMRVLDADKLIINPHKNVVVPRLHMRYAQSFLKEELGKMYQGELLLRGVPEIEPGDVVYLYDVVNDMYGPVEADSVIHQFDAEAGYVTIVRPRALVTPNDMSGLGLVQAAMETAAYLAANGWAELGQLWAGFAQTPRRSTAPEEKRDAVDTILSNAVLGGAAASVAAVGAALGAKAAVMAAALAPPALFALIELYENQAPVFLIPLSRSGYPWVAGIDGWRMESIASNFWGRWERFYTSEIAPYLESFSVLSDMAGSMK